MKHKLLTFILAGGMGERLLPLTLYRAKPAVPYLGNYRIIDFTLSNCLNSGIRQIFVLAQYRSESLERHLVQGWNFFHGPLGEFLITLPPPMRMGGEWYRGTADAIFQNLHVLEREKPLNVLILSGDHIYRMDYRKMIKFHEDKMADATIGAIPVPRKEAKRFGVMEINNEKKVIAFFEKDPNAPPMPSNPSYCLANMGVYVFSTKVLAEAVAKDSRKKNSIHDFGKNIFPEIIKEKNVYAFLLTDASPDGSNFWQDIGTLNSYYETQMAFLSKNPPFPLHFPNWYLHTYSPPYPPTEIQNSAIKNSMISGGCKIKKSKIINSILGPNVFIEEGCLIQESIIMENCTIRKNSKIKKAILDKLIEVPENYIIEKEEIKQKTLPVTITEEGIVVLPRGFKLEKKLS
jgi:glucose-1-phosphate adenylyltransferase